MELPEENKSPHTSEFLQEQRFSLEEILKEVQEEQSQKSTGSDKVSQNDLDILLNMIPPDEDE